jgi:hypothetical protein
MKETVLKVKCKMMDWLQTNKVWIKNGNLDSVETSVFGWMLAAHNTMVFCLVLKNGLIELIKSIPTDILNEAIKNYGTPEDMIDLPKLFVNSKWQSLGALPKRVQSHAVTLSCMNNKIQLMKELVCLIAKSRLIFTFIHIGLATTNSPNTYWKYLMINNDRQQALQGITVKGFSHELLQKMSKNKDKITMTVAKHFTSHKSILSIKETHKTNESGCYIFIVYKQDFQVAQSFISTFCKKIFPKVSLARQTRHLSGHLSIATPSC